MNSRSRWATFMIVVLSLCLVLSGCEFKDIDKRFFITAIGIDKPEDSGKKYRVTLKIAIPKGQLQMGQEDYMSLSLDSDSISDAIQKLKARVDKEFDFGHTRVLVIGKSLAEEDYRDPLDWFTRQRFIQRISWCVIGKPTAEKLLDSKQKSERMPANALILAFGGQGVESQYIVSQYLFQLFRKSNDPGENPVVPIASPETSKNSMYYTIDSVGVLDDTHLALVLTPDETRYYNVLSGIVNKSDYNIKMPNNTFAIHADQVKVKRKISDGENPTITVTLNFDGLVEEGEHGLQVTPQILEQIKQAAEKKLTTEMTTLLNKLQAKQVDPIGFGSLYRATHWQDMEVEVKTWEQLYKRAQFKVNVTINLRATGTIQ
ncbi:Ger(x)C family spore germination protein [Tumebacillus permanentifrigoris]|uniref:Spore germination protein KC n=1 Tax=Tumebacillus permanentifrigoris TaxID=378543 RepID=A0A316D5F1_9BACL|nr:Ger(x)C family spore germination protein [Tumebacillus permanentifrigoris]PWK05400.1 spore germination protein KC [Tumebacillus permanentifrigoris]